MSLTLKIFMKVYFMKNKGDQKEMKNNLGIPFKSGDSIPEEARLHSIVFRNSRGKKFIITNRTPISRILFEDKLNLYVVDNE